MKILFLSHGAPFPVYKNGVTLRIYHLVRELSMLAKCHLISLTDYELSKNEEKELKRIVSFDVVLYKHHRGIKGFLRKVLSNRRYYSNEFESKVDEAVRNFRPDIVFLEQTFMAQYIGNIKSIPKVISAVDAISLSAMYEARISKNLIKQLAWRYVYLQFMAFERKYFAQYDCVSVVSEEDAGFLRKKLNSDIEVIPNGVDTVFFNASLMDSERNAVLYSGNLSTSPSEEACIYLLEHVFPYLHESHPNIDYVIAGRRPTAKIKSAIPPYVNLLTDVLDMRDILRRTLLYVSPIIYGTGIKNNVLQPMAMGIPVAITPQIAKPIGIVHNQTGLVAERGPLYIQAVDAALRNVKLLDRVGHSGRLYIEKHLSWKHVASTYYKILSDLVGKSHIRKCL